MFKKILAIAAITTLTVSSTAFGYTDKSNAQKVDLQVKQVLSTKITEDKVFINVEVAQINSKAKTSVATEVVYGTGKSVVGKRKVTIKPGQKLMLKNIELKKAKSMDIFAEINPSPYKVNELTYANNRAVIKLKLK